MKKKPYYQVKAGLSLPKYSCSYSEKVIAQGRMTEYSF